jgi:drug/metabolite transporter (DMT)-like permease
MDHNPRLAAGRVGGRRFTWSMLLVVVLGLGAAAVYGASDFLGASAARRHNLISATALNYSFALVLVLVALPFVGGTWSASADAAGSVAGILATVGLIAFYGVLAIGPMSVLSPVIALIQSVVPVAIAALTGQGLSVIAWIAVGIAIVAILLLSPPSRAGRDRISPAAGALATLSGLALGGSLIALDLAPKDSGIVSAFWEIAVGLVLLLVLIPVTRAMRGRVMWVSALEPDAGIASGISSRRGWAEAAGSGLLAGVADIMIVSGLHLGNLGVIAVLVSLYPISTVILAGAVLKERIAPLQFVGIGLAIGASLLFTAA